VAIIAMYIGLLPLNDSISNLTPCRASNLSCRQTQYRFI